MDGMSLLDVLRGVMLDPAEQAAYSADPAVYLGRFGYDDVDPADLSEAFGLVADTLPPDLAQAAWEAASDPRRRRLRDRDRRLRLRGGPRRRARSHRPGPMRPGRPTAPTPRSSFGYGEAAIRTSTATVGRGPLGRTGRPPTAATGGASGTGRRRLADPDDAGTFGDPATGDESGTGDVSGEDGDDAGDDAGPDGPAADDDGAGPATAGTTSATASSTAGSRATTAAWGSASSATTRPRSTA